MTHRVDICCDLGEGFANYRSGDDEALLEHLSSANVACGFHAGDPLIMERTVASARRRGVAIGAHPGLPDRLGFGRRRMAIDAADTRAYTLYQLGALQGFLGGEGRRLHHVSPHGAFWEIIATNAELAQAFCSAVAEFDPHLLVYCTAGDRDVLPEVAQGVGLRISRMYCADLDYGADGMLMLERDKRPTDPEIVADRALKAVLTGNIVAVTGETVRYDVGTILLHGDAPNSVEVVSAVRTCMEARGITVASAQEDEVQALGARYRDTGELHRAMEFGDGASLDHNLAAIVVPNNPDDRVLETGADVDAKKPRVDRLEPGS